MKKIQVALVGLRFGESFINIYRDHPFVESVALYDVNTEKAKELAERHGLRKYYPSFEELLADDQLDAVHIISPIPCHAEQTIAVLNAGKHCACTVPMAQTLDEIYRIKEAVKQSGKNYMMMETSVFFHQTLYVKGLYESGQLGNIQFMQGTYYQDFCGLGSYWQGLPPMMYATHAVGPLVELAGCNIARIRCMGVGKMSGELTKCYGNPFPIECAMLEFENGITGEVIRTMFETAKDCKEAFQVFGSKMSFEWGLRNTDRKAFITHMVETASVPVEERGPYEGTYHLTTEYVDIPNSYKNLPPALWKYTMEEGEYKDGEDESGLLVAIPAPHQGAAPRLVHEFVSSIIEERKPYIDINKAINISAAGIIAHESAMNDGKPIDMPKDLFR